MVVKNPETINNSESPEKKQELNELKIDIFNKSKDLKKFEALSKDSSVINGLKKVSNKCCEKAFSEQWKHFEKLNIGKTIENILKKYPSLWLEISGKLGLSLSERKFSKLSLQQKLNFTALHSAIFGKTILYKKNPSSQDIINRIKHNQYSNLDKINLQFKLKNVNNFLKLESTLKEFGLTSAEVGKVKEYLLLIKKHPEFLYGQPTVLECRGDGLKYVAILLAALLGFVLGAAGMHWIDNLGKIDPETTTRLDGITTIENPKNVLKLLTQQAEFKRSGSTKIEMFKKEEDDWAITSIVKEWANKVQSKDIEMELSGKIGMEFDLDKGCRIDIDIKDGKGVAYVQLPQPDVIARNSKAKVLSENREWVHLKEFDQAQENLRQELEQKAISDAKNDPKFYEKGKKDVEKQLYDLLSALHPDGIDIVGVKVSFFDPEKGESPRQVYPDLPQSGPILNDRPKSGNLPLKK